MKDSVKKNARKITWDDDSRRILNDLNDYRDYATKCSERQGRENAFYSLIIATIDTVKAIYDATDFYEGRRQMDLRETPGALLCREDGVIRRLERIAQDPQDLMDGIRQSEMRVDVLALVSDFLEDFLYRVLGEPLDSILTADWSGGDRLAAIKAGTITDLEIEEFCICLEMQIVGLQNRQMQLQLLEETIYDEHPEWKYVEDWGGKANPDIQDCTESRRLWSKGFHEYFENLHGRSPLSSYYWVTDCLDAGTRDDPRAFVHISGDIDCDIRFCLSLDTTFPYKDPRDNVIFGNPDCISTGDASVWLTEAKRKFVLRLLEVLEERFEATSKGSASRRLWAEVLAEYMSHKTSGQCPFLFKEKDADAFLAMANKAAREEWIERRLADDRPNDRPSFEERLLAAAEQTASTNARMEKMTSEQLSLLREERAERLKQMHDQDFGKERSSRIGKACSPFVTYFNKKERVIRMRVKVASGTTETTFKIVSDDGKLWNVITQLVQAKQYPIALENPWAPSKLNLKARFRKTENPEDGRHLFYKYIRCVGKGSKAKYELKVG